MHKRPAEPVQVVRCAGAIVFDDLGRLLLIRRGNPPEAGRWSLPGGRIERGETNAQAAVREVLEETGLTVTASRLVGRIHRPAQPGVVYEIEDWACSAAPEGAAATALRAGDDAVDARFVPPHELDSLELSTGLVDTLRGWGVLD